MTTLIGAFSDNAMDVIMASDGQRSAESLSTGESWPVGSPKIKSVRINDNCCMVCAGKTTYANQVYAALFNRQEWGGHQHNLDVTQVWNSNGLECADLGVEQVHEFLDKFGQQHMALLGTLGDTDFNVLLAGSVNMNNPVLYLWGKSTKWECSQMPPRHPVYITPLVGEEREEFERIAQEPGKNLRMRVLNAMYYASLHNAATNEHVTLRWWKKGFIEEPVIVSAKPSSNSGALDP